MAYAESLRWQVFPCRPRAKTPACAHGCLDATSDPGKLETFFGGSVDLNLGLACGPESGVWVLDTEREGLEALDDLQHAHGELPVTVASRTGRGGLHHFWKCYLQDAEIRNRAKLDGLPIDVRGAGGYVILPPSIHENGTAYAWEKSPFETPIAVAPAWLREWVVSGGNGEAQEPLIFTVGAGGESLAAAPGVSQGGRHQAALRLIGVELAKGTDLVEVARLAVEWAQRCSPPLPDAEVLKIVDDLNRKEAAKPATIRLATRKPQEPPPPPWAPFPVQSLPQPVRRFVKGAAAAIGTDPAYVATAILPTLAGVIGNSRAVLLKRGWTEPAILWGVLVGESGTIKSPVIDAATRPVRRLQSKAIDEHRQALERYEEESAEHKIRHDEWKRSGRKRHEPAPEEPAAPACRRFCCSDTTVEALAGLLEQTPRGLLLIRDELSGWLGSFDQYKRGGKGSDTAHWLSMHGARDLIVDRKGGDRRTVFVPRASVSIVGGIQPEVLKRALGAEHIENGLAARLLPAMPPRSKKAWAEREIDARLDQEHAELVESLYRLQPQVGDGGQPEPVIVGLSAEGKAAWVKFFNEHAEALCDAEGNQAAILSKAEGAAARIALVLHLVRLATGDAKASAVDQESVQAGVTIARWYAAEADRIYRVLRETEAERRQRRLVDLIRRRGGSITANDLRRRSRLFATSEEAERMLDDLARAGIGKWEDLPPTEAGGRPTRTLVLLDGVVSETPEFPEGKRVSVTETTSVSENEQWEEYTL